MSKKLISPLIISIILISGLIAGLYLIRQQQLIIPRAAPATTLSLTPSSSSPAIGGTFTVAVNINTGENTVSAAELHFTYTGTSVAAQSIAAGSFFANPTVYNAKVGAGTADITVLGGPGGSKQGSGVLATITFRAESAGSSTISVDQSTQVSGIGEGSQNVFLSSSPTTVTVQGGTSPTATLTLTLTPTGDASPTSTLTPTGSANPTSTPRPTATPTNHPAQGGGSIPTPTISAIPTLPVAGGMAQTLGSIIVGLGLILVSLLFVL